ncbi:MAG: hypothetical protein U0325_34765 [Polyangiales bacterium]
MTSGASNQAFLYLGGAAAMASTPAATWSTGVGTAFGHPVAGAGRPQRRDGYADVAIGATDAGYVNLYYGGAMRPPAVEIAAPARRRARLRPQRRRAQATSTATASTTCWWAPTTAAARTCSRAQRAAPRRRRR